MLHNLHHRFVKRRAIYTYCGIVLVAVNPYAQIDDLYSDEMISVSLRWAGFYGAVSFVRICPSSHSLRLVFHSRRYFYIGTGTFRLKIPLHFVLRLQTRRISKKTTFSIFRSTNQWAVATCAIWTHISTRSPNMHIIK